MKSEKRKVKNNILLFIISLLFLSCLEERKEISFWDDFYKTPYIISEKNKYFKAADDSLAKAGIPREIIPYSNDKYGSVYGHLNIIFYTNKIFLHTKNLIFRCGCCGDEPLDIIDFIDLKPSDIIQIPNDSLNSYINIVKSKLSSFDSSSHSVTISSLSDTIINPTFNTLIDSIRKINPRFFVRRVTEEEHHVLDAKTRNIPYDPKNYKWTMNYGLPIKRILDIHQN